MGERADDGTPQTAHLTVAQVSQLWARYRAGDVIRCPRDSSGIALAVDGAAKAYRLVCTQCGLSSPWFGTTPTGIVIPQPGSLPPPSSSGSGSKDG